jgi:hypothetical protein
MSSSGHSCPVGAFLIEKVTVSQFGQVLERGYRCKCADCGYVGDVRDSENRVVLDWFDDNLHIEDAFFDSCEVENSKPFSR